MRWFKRIAIGAAAVLALAAIGVLALVLLVDPNHYKGPVADAVKKRYDRTLRIDGDLKLSVFPNLGVEVERLSLSEPRSTQIFAAVDRARASVAVLPLLSGRIVVDGIKVAGLKANIVRYQNGKLNFEDLLGKSAPAPGGPADGPLQAEGKPLLFDVAGVEFSGGELALRDYVRGTSMRVERLAATTGRVAPRTPFDFRVSARVLGQSPRVDATVQSEGRLTFDPGSRAFSVEGFDLKASGVLPSVRATALTARGDLAYDGQRQAIDASGVSVVFQGDVAGNRPLTGVDLRVEAPRLTAGLAEGRLRAEKLSLSAQGKLGPDPFDVSLAAPALNVSPQEAEGEAVTGRLRLSGARDLDMRLALTGISGNADKVEVGRATLDGELRQGDRLVKLASASPLEASLRRKTLALSRITGQVDIDDPALPAGPMHIPVKGSVRANLDKEHLAARLDGSIEGGEFSATADVAQFDEPRITFSAAAQTLDLDKLAPPQSPRPPRAPAAAGTPSREPAERPVDLSVLKGVTASGNLKIGQLVARGLKAANVSASIRVAKGRADVSGLRAALYGGTLSGSLFADAGTNRIGLAPTLSNISVQPLLADLSGKDTLMGRGTVALNLTATGKTVEAMKRGLNGTANIALRDGAIKGVNLAQSLREFRSMLTQRKDGVLAHEATRQTDFSELQAQLVFAAGVGTVRSLSVKAPLLRIAEGEPARIDIPQGRFDLEARVTVVNTTTGQDGKDLAELRNVTVPVHVAGPFDAPSYTIEWSKVAGDVLKKALEGKIQEELGVEPSESGDKLRDAVRDRLKGLFK
ncbi:MAG: AsmA family protein [Pigmentiphaga sp.]|uniref:AsmA family protein n=1 Tax=Pigmentiphaga sp. TaxID=1977564 RepID=UPI0029BABED2|nr:AsmA family protein [Pigmentiphaga sp.]MDX3905846.1 AsmA family protein [Pigmentiphaga sp.]